MMEPHTIVAPNLNGLVYRNHIPERSIDNYNLDIVDINQDNELIFGCSNLNGRFWDGCLAYYKNTPEYYPSEQIKSSLILDYGVTDTKFLNDNKKVILSHDSGDLNIVAIIDDKLEHLEKYTNYEHEERITEISLWPKSNNFVTSCADYSIKTWEISDSNITSLQDYNDAHFNVVSSVTANPNDAHIFVSSSYDRTALLWDKRAENSGYMIYENEFCALTKILFHPTKSHIVIVGNSAGDIYMIDIREPLKFVFKNSCFQRSIHNLKFNSNGLLAVCADDTTLKVFDTTNEDLKLLYSDDRHEDFVRGLIWQEDTLISCGWDKKIYKHSI